MRVPEASASGAPQLQDFGEEEEQTRIADTSALAGAFSAAVSDHAPHSVSDPLSMPGDEWFVGINGVPVGPIRLSELRSKAASRAITKESLVWRDGFEEWRPLKSFPELVAILEESLSSARGSLEPMATATRVGATGEVLSDPFAATAPQSFGSPRPSGMLTGASVTDDLEAAGLQRRRGTSPVVWAAMVIAVLLGLTIGFVIFGNAKKTEVVYVEVPAKGVAPAVNSVAATEPVAPAEDHDPKGSNKGPLSSTKTTQPKTEGDSKLTGGLKGLGLSGLSAQGPKGPNGTDAPSSTGGGQLDQAQLQPVVARYTPSVKRSCWQPALDGRAKDAPVSARVNVSITISASGGVQKVATNGDPRGYPGLASCIAGRVRGWQFPPSSGATTVNVPFVFVAQ